MAVAFSVLALENCQKIFVSAVPPTIDLLEGAITYALSYVLCFRAATCCVALQSVCHEDWECPGGSPLPAASKDSESPAVLLQYLHGKHAVRSQAAFFRIGNAALPAAQFFAPSSFFSGHAAQRGVSCPQKTGTIPSCRAEGVAAAKMMLWNTGGSFALLPSHLTFSLTGNGDSWSGSKTSALHFDIIRFNSQSLCVTFESLFKGFSACIQTTQITERLSAEFPKHPGLQLNDFNAGRDLKNRTKHI